MAVAYDSDGYGRYLVGGVIDGTRIACVHGDDHIYAIDRMVIADDARRERERDRAFAVRIAHANVIPNVEVDVTGDELQVVTSHISGVTLDMIERRDPDPRPRVVLRVLIDVLYGLHAVHVRGLAHGRVCPSNIVVGADGVARVGGFHRANPNDAVLYDAPELAATDGDADARADVFSLGVVLWNSLTGKTLYAATEDRSTIYTREVPRPSAIGRRPPAILDSIVLKAIALDPAARFGSAEEMAHAIRDVAIKTACLGTPEEVSDWVARLFTTEIDEQHAVIGRARSAAIPVHAMPEAVATSAPIATTPPGSTRNLVVVSALAAVVVAGVLAWVWRSRSATSSDELGSRSAIEITMLDRRVVPRPPPPAVAPVVLQTVPPPVVPPPVVDVPAPVPATAPAAAPSRPPVAVKRVAPRAVAAPPRAKPDDARDVPPKPAANPAATPLENNPYVYK